jgi:NADPH:quinone reductase-like Zn-dependent oxidoreductase
MKAYEINQFGIDNLAIVERAVPHAGEKEVVVKLRAASVNHRDLMMVSGTYNPKLKTPLIPFSDGAGEVVEVGSSVTKWHVGDRVCPIFMQGWVDGDIDFKKARTTLGGDLDGCLREFAAFDEHSLVRIPDHLSYEEASTLPCAAVTAYNALFHSRGLKDGESILLQGTGGVSIFALQFASVLGCRIFVTSSSNEKLERARALSACEAINYMEFPDWDSNVLDLTSKTGVDHVVEVGGAGTLAKSIRAVRTGGYIAVVGALSGRGQVDPTAILMKSVTLRGIFVGSRQMFEQMNLMLCQHNYLRPVIDKIFEFDEVSGALKYMQGATHFGKIVVRID